MYAFTRVWIGAQDATMQMGIMKVVRSTNGIEMPSTPSLYRIACENQSRSSMS